MTLALILAAYAATSAIACLLAGHLINNAKRLAASIDRDTQARRPRNLSQHAEGVKADRKRDAHSFHKPKV